MKRIILQEFITIDCFAADLNGGMNFQQDYVSRNDQSFQTDALLFLDSVDTMLMGAKTYKFFVDYWPTAADRFAEQINLLSKYVVSLSLKKAPWGKWEAARIIEKNIVKEITALKKQAGKDIALWGSMMLAQELSCF